MGTWFNLERLKSSQKEMIRLENIDISIVV